MRKKFGGVLAALISVAFCFAGAITAEAGKKKPNVIIFMADDLGQDATSLYTEATEDPDFPENAPTVNLTRLAEHGVTFKNAWAMPVCSTTRAARSTGKYATTTGVGQVIGPLTPRFGAPGSRFDDVEFPPSILDPDDKQLLQRLVRNAGYRTWKFGKWHEIEVDVDEYAPFDALDLSDVNAGILAAQGLDDVHRSGFDEFYGLLSGAYGGINLNGYGGGELPGTGGTTSDSILLIDTRKGGADPRNPTNEFADSAMVSRAIKLIREAKDAGVPYFMEFSALAPHFEYEVAPGPLDTEPTDFAGEDGGWRTLNTTEHGDVIAQVIIAFSELDDQSVPTAQQVRDNPDAYLDLYPAVGTRPAGPPFNTPTSIAQRRAAFKSLVAYMDVQLGRLMEHVNLHNTYVIFVGDNGTQGGGRFGVVEDPNDNARSKATVYRNGVEVPLVLAGPGKYRVKGSVTKDLANVTDLFATVLDLVGVKQPKDTRKSSYSFARVLEGGRSKRRVNVSEMFNATATVGGTAVGNTPFGGAGRRVGDARFSLLAFDRVDSETGTVFECIPGAGVLSEEDCFDEESGEYLKVIDLEFYDKKFDPFENDALLRDEMSDKQFAKFRGLCNRLNKMSKRATYFQNGKICQLNGSNLRDVDPVEAAAAAQ